MLVGKKIKVIVSLRAIYENLIFWFSETELGSISAALSLRAPFPNSGW